MTHRFGERRKKEQGIALVAVLWVLALLGIIAAGFLRETRVETGVIRNFVANSKAEALAEAGVQRAMLGLLDPDEETAWRADGSPYEFRLGEGVVRVSMQDEAGKIDLNYAPDQLLFALFDAIGVGADEATALVDAIAAFRDRKRDQRRSTQAADTSDEAVDLANEAKAGEFESVEELLQVRGMTREIYELVAPNLTVYSGSRKVTAVNAPAIVLQILPDVTAQEREEILARRRSGTAPADSRPEIVTVVAAALTADGGAFIREAVLRRTDEPEQPFAMLAWRQRWRTMTSPQAEPGASP